MKKSVPEKKAKLAKKPSPDSPSLWPCLALVRITALFRGVPDRKKKEAFGGASRGIRDRADLDKKEKNHSFSISLRPQIRRDYALNLSISLRAGKETN